MNLYKIKRIIICLCGEAAVAPLNKYSTIRKELSLQGYNPGCEFGRIMQKETGRPILLVVNARGGSHISHE